MSHRAAAQSDLDRQIAAFHKRFVRAMEERMGDVSSETREAYLAILMKLVAKLETAEKPLKEILQEMMAEAMTEVLQMIQS
jgi:hypothetical protein